MPRSVPPAVPPLLSFVAGYVDSCTFLALFGLFVAQVTGSFVLAGAQLATHDPGVVVRWAGVLVFFLAGIATAVMVRTAEWSGRRAMPAAFALEAVLLTCLLASWLAGSPLRGPNSPAVLFASLSGLSAMGVQSTLVRLLGSPSTNVMTTNTTQLAINTAEFVLARWLRRSATAGTKATAEYSEMGRKLTELWLIMLGFLIGTLAGAIAYVRLDLWCVVLPIAIICGLSVWTTTSITTDSARRH